MIFNYPNNKFIEDGRNDRLLIENFAFMISQPIRLGPVDEVPTDEPNVLKDITFLFQDQILKVYAGEKRITNITQLLFIMSESEISSAQDQMYRRSSGDDIHRSNTFSPEVKASIQSEIEKLATLNGIVIAENINFFNDKFVLYLFPLLRSMTNANTNFYKVLEDLRFSHDGDQADNYTIPQTVMEQTNIADALKVYIGTSSKVVTRFVANNIVRKTDLVKSLSPQLLDILINHSGKIFANSGRISPDVKILTCYEDIMLDVFLYVKYAMELFSDNVDHVQKFLASKDVQDNYKTNKKVAVFLSENFSTAKIFNILNDKSNEIHSLSDIVNQFNQYKNPDSIPRKLKLQYPNGLELPKNWKTAKELHDKVSADYNKIKAEDNNKIIEYSPTEFQLHGLTEGDIELVLPSEGSTLVEWGRDQKHCVASYADRAAQKACLIMGVKVAGVHTYTLELRTHENITADKQTIHAGNGLEEIATDIQRTSVWSCEIVQFLGVGNSNPDKKHEMVVLTLLKDVFTAGVGHSFGMSRAANDLARALEADVRDALVFGDAVPIQGIDAQLRANGN